MTFLVETRSVAPVASKDELDHELGVVLPTRLTFSILRNFTKKY